MSVREKARSFNRTIRRRDLLEGSVALGLVLLFSHRAWVTPGWLPWLGVAVFSVLCGVVCWRLYRTRTWRTPAVSSLPVLERVRLELDKVDDQIELLEGVGRWYHLPLAVGGVAVVLSRVPALGLPWLPSLVVAAVQLLLLVAVFTVFGRKWLVPRNRAAVHEQLVPYREELVELLAMAEETANADRS